MDLSGDIWLVIAPLYILQNMNLAGDHRRLLIAIFSCGVFVTAASIARVCFILTGQSLMIGIMGHLQVRLEDIPYPTHSLILFSLLARYLTHHLQPFGSRHIYLQKND